MNHASRFPFVWSRTDVTICWSMGGGKLRGVISQQDLILLQGANPVAVVGGVDKQTDLAGIKTCVDHMSIVQQGLLVQGGTMQEPCPGLVCWFCAASHSARRA